MKKNEEYQALDHEIEDVKAQISRLEDEEIQVLLDIDEQKAAEVEAEAVCREKTDVLEGRMAKLEERAARCRDELDEAVRRYDEAREPVGEPWLGTYERLRKHVRFPVVVPMADKKCQGCHLRVSAGVESEARRGKEIAACDNCGRILYFDS